jgi:ribosomal protein S18 acetylase RimI-like enzyme
MNIIDYSDCYRKNIVEIWNNSLVKDLVNMQDLARLISNDPNFDSTLCPLMIEETAIAGFAIGIKRKVPYYSRGLERDSGWIIASGVLPEYRSKGIGTKLLDYLEGRLYESGVQKIIIGSYSPNYFMPGLDCDSYPDARRLLTKRGYQLYDPHYSMYRVLFGYEIPEIVKLKKVEAEKKGYRFAAYTESDENALLEFLSENFSASWLHNAKTLITQNRAEDQTFLCFSPNGEIVGFVQRGMNNQSSRFGPFGVKESCRNHSIGSILLAHMLYDMAKRGIYLAYFMTTDEIGARLYKRFEFSKFRTFYDCKKFGTPG